MPAASVSLVRRLVSPKSVLPPSMRMSPCSQVRLELADQLVDRGARLDHHHDLPRRLEIADELAQRVIARDRLCLWPGPSTNSSVLLVVRLKTPTEKP